MNVTVLMVCVAVPIFVNLACGVVVAPVGNTVPVAGTRIDVASMSFAGGAVPLGSSAPMSGAATRI